MAITTYAELQTAVQNWLGRDDINTRIPDFIAAGETRIADDLRVRAMETELSATTLSTGDNSITYPADCIQLKTLWIREDDNDILLNQAQEEEVRARYPDYSDSDIDGKPVYFFINSSDEIVFQHDANEDYVIHGTYYKKLALSATVTTNWFLANYPMILLYAAMIEAMIYIEDDPRRYEAMYAEIVARIRRRESKETRSVSKNLFRQVSI